MKKLITALLCALMLLSGAHAESDALPSPTPEIPAQEQGSGSLDFTINGEAIKLDFDPRPEYSLIMSGYIQASFYAYDAANQLYELYVTFPQSVQPGQTLTPEISMQSAAIGTGLMLFISDDSGKDLCSAATQDLAGSYPAGSAYSLTFDTVSPSGALCHFTGSFEASLAEVDNMFRPTGNVNVCSASFDFTMDLGSTAPQQEPSIPGATPEPFLPEATPEPSALPQVEYPPQPQEKLVTPPDARPI